MEILGCCQSMGRLVLPVFYNIEPSVVRYQTGSFSEAFNTHESRFDKDRLDKWRLTLMKVGNFSGYRIHENMSQIDIIHEIVDKILHEINPSTLDVAKYPVGLDSRVEDITSLLSNVTKGVTRIGIYGMGGVGKTTLAKAVFNQHYHRFQGSCFLPNVREASETRKGLAYLQQKLISDVLKCRNIIVDNVDQGIELIRARICSTQVLIVVDDLDSIMPLEFLEGPFAFGSTIIITTRHEDLLESIRVEAKYKVNELGDAESHQLFCQHAFGGDVKMSNTFSILSQEILERARGLPLALKVCGSTLLNKSEENWRWFIDKLRRDSIVDIENILLISFDALKLVDPVMQDIFLDIACFFVGREKGEVVQIMETCYKFLNHGIDLLKKRSLLTIDNENRLRMHDLLRDMGRKVVRNNSPIEYGKHSRLWRSQDIYDVLEKQEGTEAIEGIIPSNFLLQINCTLVRTRFAAKQFIKMSRLRFLYLDHVDLTGSLTNTFKDLRWLYWWGCPLKCLPSEFYPQKLVFLALPRSKMRTMWELNMIPHVFGKLKTLDMSNCEDLTTTTDFTKMPCLEFINLEGCSSLEEVHISIGSLKRLVSLNLRFCENLKCLPHSICNLKALKSLNITCCHGLQAIPINLGNIESLVELDAEDLSVCKLPNSIGLLSNLINLNLHYNCNLETLPDTICNLRSIEILDIGCTGQSEMGSLKALPIELGNIESLKELKAGALGILKLPESIGHLSKLVKLDLGNNFNLENLPDSICNLRALKNLDIGGCTSLEVLPIDLGNLESLVELYAGKLSISNFPESIRHIRSLETLILADCCHLLNIAELPSNLKRIGLERCTSMDRLPNLSNMKQLEEIDLTGCSGLTEIQGLEELTSIKTLHMGGCNSSLLANTFTKRFFQVYSSFGQHIKIYAPSSVFPDWISQSADWISQSSNSASTVYLHLPPNVSHNFLGMVLCFEHMEALNLQRASYSVMTTTNNFAWSDRGNLPFSDYDDEDYDHLSCMDIVPKSVFSLRDSDDKIKFTAAPIIFVFDSTPFGGSELIADATILGIHLLYKTETAVIDKCEITIVSAEEERSCPSKQSKHFSL
ncbi:TMV resistance protein N-like isoform X2 [Apium graveolens]